MSRICNMCRKVIPAGSTSYIHVDFYGNIAEKVRRIIGDSQLDFCSIECFDKFTIGDTGRKRNTRHTPTEVNPSNFPSGLDARAARKSLYNTSVKKHSPLIM